MTQAASSLRGQVAIVIGDDGGRWIGQANALALGAEGAAELYMHSETYLRTHGEAMAHGCRNLSARLFETSPVLRGPVRPARS